MVKMYSRKDTSPLLLPPADMVENPGILTPLGATAPVCDTNEIVEITPL